MRRSGTIAVYGSSGAVSAMAVWVVLLCSAPAMAQMRSDVVNSPGAEFPVLGSLPVPPPCSATSGRTAGCGELMGRELGPNELPCNGDGTERCGPDMRCRPGQVAVVAGTSDHPGTLTYQHQLDAVRAWQVSSSTEGYYAASATDVNGLAGVWCVEPPPTATAHACPDCVCDVRCEGGGGATVVPLPTTVADIALPRWDTAVLRVAPSATAIGASAARMYRPGDPNEVSFTGVAGFGGAGASPGASFTIAPFALARRLRFERYRERAIFDAMLERAPRGKQGSGVDERWRRVASVVASAPSRLLDSDGDGTTSLASDGFHLSLTALSADGAEATGDETIAGYSLALGFDFGSHEASEDYLEAVQAAVRAHSTSMLALSAALRDAADENDALTGGIGMKATVLDGDGDATTLEDPELDSFLAFFALDWADGSPGLAVTVGADVGARRDDAGDLSLQYAGGARLSVPRDGFEFATELMLANRSLDVADVSDDVRGLHTMAFTYAATPGLSIDLGLQTEYVPDRDRPISTRVVSNFGWAQARALAADFVSEALSAQLVEQMTEACSQASAVVAPGLASEQVDARDVPAAACFYLAEAFQEGELNLPQDMTSALELTERACMAVSAARGSSVAVGHPFCDTMRQLRAFESLAR